MTADAKRLTHTTWLSIYNINDKYCNTCQNIIGNVTNDFYRKKNYQIQTVDIGTIGLKENKIGHLKNEFSISYRHLGGGGYR